MSKLLRKLSYSFALLIIILAVVLSAARALAPLLGNYQPQLQALITRLMHMPTTFENVKVTWYWLEPVLEFSDVTVLKESDHHAILKIKKLDIGLDIIETLLTRRFATGILIASGSQLTLHQNTNGDLSIEGGEDLAKGLNKQGVSQEAGYILDWLFSQDKIALRNIDLNWIRADSTVVPIHNFSFSLINEGNVHHIRGHGILAQTIPSRITIISKFEGKAHDLLHWKGDLYIKAVDVLIGQWLSNYSLLGFTAKTGQLTAECWLNWQALQITSMKSQFWIKNFNLALENNADSQFFPQLNGKLNFTRNNNDWQLQMDDFTIRSEGETWPNNQWLLTKTTDAEQKINYQFYIHYLQLQTLFPLFAKNDKLPEWLTQPILNLKPQGELFESVFEHTIGTQIFNIKTQFKQFANQAWQHIPGLKGLSGEVEIVGENGQLQFDSPNLTLETADLFRNPLTFSLTGDFEFRHDVDGWWLIANDSEIKNDDLSLNTGFTWHLPPQPSAKAELYLLGGFSFNNTKHIANYLPAKLPASSFDPDLVTWLEQAFDGGGSGVGTMLFRGAIDDFPFKDHQGIFSIESNINNFNLHFAKNWPLATQLFGELDFRNEAMFATIFSGNLEKVPLHNIAAEIAELNRSPRILKLNGDITTKAEDVLQFLTDSPAKESVHTLKEVELQGPVYLAVELFLPFKDLERDYSLTIDALLKDAKLVLPYWHHEINKINGSLQITKNGVNGENLDANLFSRPAKIFISPALQNEHSSQTSVTILSDFPWFSNDKLQGTHACEAESDFVREIMCNDKDSVNGSSSYLASITIPNNTKDPLTFFLSSDLTGIYSDLPDLFNKSATQSLPFFMKATLHDNSLRIATTLKQKLSAVLQLERNGKDWQVRKGNLFLGNGRAHLPMQKNLIVSGELESFEADRWLPLLKKLWSTPSPFFSENLMWYDLTLKNISLYGITFPVINIQANAENQGVSLHFSGPMVQGDITIPLRENKNIKADLKRLVITTKPTILTKIALNPSDVPSMSIKINQLLLNDIPLGSFSLNTTQQKKVLTIDQFTLVNDINSLQAKGQWSEEKGKDSTYLKGIFATKSLAKTLSQLGFTPFITAKSVKSEFNVNWQGSPYDFDMKQLNGTASLKIKDGNITHLDADTERKIGIGRLINILSLQSLPRRLMLDFTDLTKEGFHFNTLRSQLQLERGSAKLSATSLEAPVASIDMSGTINLAKKRYDLLLNVTPQVTASLPVIIAAAAASPIAGAVTFVASKIVSQIMEKTLYYTYQVKGPWENPKVSELGEKKT